MKKNFIFPLVLMFLFLSNTCIAADFISSDLAWVSQTEVGLEAGANCKSVCDHFNWNTVISAYWYEDTSQPNSVCRAVFFTGETKRPGVNIHANGSPHMLYCYGGGGGATTSFDCLCFQ